MLGVAEPHGDLALDVERQPLLGAADEEMHVAAHRPEEILAAAEQLIFVLVEDAALDQLVRLAHAIDVFGDPEQRVQVAQAALAVLDVRLDQIARLPAAAVRAPRVRRAWRRRIRRRCRARPPCRSALISSSKSFAVAEQEARFEDGGADGHVRLGLADAFVDRARGVADLQPEVPQAIEDRFGDQLAPGGLLVRAAGTADRCRSRAPAGRGRSRRWRRPPCVRPSDGILRRIEMLRAKSNSRRMISSSIRHSRSAQRRPWRSFKQQLLGLGAAFGERGLQPLRHSRPQLVLVAAMRSGRKFFELGRNSARASIRSSPRAGASDDCAQVIDSKRSHGHSDSGARVQPSHGRLGR